MKKHLNIFSLLVLAVYGTLTLVAVPLHHHTIEYADTPHYQSVTTHHGDGCDVCTFAAGSYTVSVSFGLCSELADNSSGLVTINSPKNFSSLFTKEYPRRGPPAFLA